MYISEHMSSRRIIGIILLIFLMVVFFLGYDTVASVIVISFKVQTLLTTMEGR